MPVTWRSVIDYLSLCIAFYIILRWASLARALRLALSVAGLYGASLVARELNLVISAWLLQAAAYIVLALVVVLFQPELRRALLQLDSRLFRGTPGFGATRSAFGSVADAAFSMAAQKIGAILVVVRHDSIDELMEGGVPVGAEITAPLLEATFQKNSPIHDGAAIIAQNRITRANVVLPLTQRHEIPFEYGTRHRAAMGLAERSDAIVIVVSEERGEVTLMRGAERHTMKSPEDLTDALGSILEQKQSAGRRIHDLIFAKWPLKLAATALATLVWLIALLLPGNIVRTVRIPVEFADVPRTLDISEQSATTVDVQIRGRTWAMDALAVPALVARFNLSGSRSGVRIIRVGAAALDLPLGITLISVQPDVITVKLVPRKQG